MCDGKNGSICCYADDSTFTISDPDPGTLTTKLSEKYKNIAEFMVNNRLKLNDDKTHLLVMNTGKSEKSDQVCLVTQTEVIKPSKCEKLLGCWVQQDLKWTEHLRDSSDSLTKSLNIRLGALKKIRRLTNFKNRKMITEGIFMCKLSYLIVLWGGCGQMLKYSLQIIQNKAARLVTGLDWSTSVKVLLLQCGWLSVNQLIFYHSVLQVFKVQNNKSPRYLHNMHSSSTYQYNTRLAKTEVIKLLGKPRLKLTENSYKWRAASQFNLLPAEIRNCETLDNFKLKSKAWIKINVPLH